MLFFCFLAISVSADGFLHERDVNSTISDLAMTTSPRLNDYLAIEFDVKDVNSIVLNNSHIHLKTYDNQGRMIHDYSVKFVTRSDSAVTLQTLNHSAIDKSGQYEFFRTTQPQTNSGSNTLEYRIVSNDSGHVKALLFLNACQVGETQNCYFQTGIYTLNILQKGLDRTEDFTIDAEITQSFSVVQWASYAANNTDAILIIGFAVLIIFSLFVLIILLFLKYGGAIK